MYENVKAFREDDLPLGILFVGETLCDEKFCISRKNSDLNALEFIVEGEGTLEINGQILHPKKNDVFFLEKGSEHKYYCSKEKPWRKYFVSFYGPVGEALIKHYIGTNKYLFENCALKNEFERIFDIAFNNDDVSKATAQIGAQLFNVFNYLYSHQNLQSTDLASKIKQCLENNITEEFNLDRLCESLNYSKNHIINVFFEKYGVTPYNYYKTCKIQLAKEYLTNTQMTVGEISSALSFADRQYFSYAFKKETGYSPKNYRELVRF